MLQVTTTNLFWKIVSKTLIIMIWVITCSFSSNWTPESHFIVIISNESLCFRRIKKIQKHLYAHSQSKSSSKQKPAKCMIYINSKKLSPIKCCQAWNNRIEAHFYVSMVFIMWTRHIKPILKLSFGDRCTLLENETQRTTVENTYAPWKPLISS